jgi:hypothetical protein
MFSVRLREVTSITSMPLSTTCSSSAAMAEVDKAAVANVPVTIGTKSAFLMEEDIKDIFRFAFMFVIFVPNVFIIF